MIQEIEFLAVGEASKAGDAIIVLYGDGGTPSAMIIDGGHAETGETIVARLKRYYGPNPVVEHVLLTHSDGDHASGLRAVLKEVIVLNLWLHIPWQLAEEARHLFADKRWTPDGLRKTIRDEYDVIVEIVTLATQQGTTLHFPFAGDQVGPFRVLSPTRYAYRHLLPQFDRTPAADEAAIKAAQMWLGKASLAQRMTDAARAAVQSWTSETWDHERLRDGGITSASNETSVVLYGAFHRGPMLLTGDAGNNGLIWAANEADRLGLPLCQFNFVQIPHHGSRRNVGPTALDRLLGPRLPSGSALSSHALVSAPADDAAHPRRIVLNAFQRRGFRVVGTQGKDIVYPGRVGSTAVAPTPFYARVEEYT
ncbi:MBL fold metallo-hydrolase [Methylobacterium fujisawaense]|uniref:MBL fold metallo-hydrolase n=1 Tax=Methylobacterium fujisawaense TaxID=107400 RepID=UPI00313B68F5